MTYGDDDNDNDTIPLPSPPDRIRVIRGTTIWRIDDDNNRVERHIDRSIIVYGLYITNRRPRLYTFVHDGWPWFVEARKVDRLS